MMNGYLNTKNRVFKCFNMTDGINKRVIVKYSGFLKHDGMDASEIMSDVSENYDNLNTFKNLKGNFVIAIYDVNKNHLLLVRDHFGIHPLYYSIHNSIIYFGSTINSIISNLKLDVKINYDRVCEYFMFGFVSGNYTLFDKVIELEPGSIAKYNGHGNVCIKKYFTSNYSEELSEKHLNYSKSFEDAFDDSLNFNTFDKDSKVYGALSSGGLDSSIVVSKASKVLRPNFPCYYIGFENYEYNRFKEVKKLSKLYGCKHHDYLITHEEFANSVIETIKINGEPIIFPGNVATNILYKNITNEVDVLLSGTGADSFYCGYYIYYLIYYLYAKNPINWLNKIFANIIPTRYVPKKYESYFMKIKNALLHAPDEYTIYYDILAINTKEGLSKMINYEIKHDYFKNYENIFFNHDKSNILNKILSLYQTYFIVDDLNSTFKLGHHYNIEHRYPFINYNMINMFNAFPWKEKLRYFKRKYLVYEMGKYNLPKYILGKPKEGFGVPMKKWFHEKKGLKQFIEILNDKKTIERGIYNANYLKNIISLYTQDKLPNNDYESILWPLINFELWCRVYIDKCS